MIVSCSCIKVYVYIPVCYFVNKEVKIYLDIIENQPQPAETMFDYLYETLPEKCADQRADVIKRRASK